VAAGCAYGRRKFDELSQTRTGGGASAVALEAMQRSARIYHVERLAGRQQLSRPLWNELRAWSQLKRTPRGRRHHRPGHRLQPERWDALHLSDGQAPNNHLEQQIKPWKLGAKNWLFVGRELAGEQAAVVMSPVQ
jgi:transposase